MKRAGHRETLCDLTHIKYKTVDIIESEIRVATRVREHFYITGLGRSKVKHTDTGMIRTAVCTVYLKGLDRGLHML